MTSGIKVSDKNMFICLWLTISPCTSHIVQWVLTESGQFARKNTPRSKSLNYIARDKIKRVTLYTSPYL